MSRTTLFIGLLCLPLLGFGLPSFPVEPGLRVIEVATNGTSVAWSTSREKGPTYLSVDGVTTGPYDRVGDLGWSADGTVLGYTTLSGNTLTLWVGGKKVTTFDGTSLETFGIRWAPVGHRYYAVGKKKGSSVLVCSEGTLILGRPVSRDVLYKDGPTLALGAVFDDQWVPSGETFYFFFSGVSGTSLYRQLKKVASYPDAGRLSLSAKGVPAYAIHDREGFSLIRGQERLGPYSFINDIEWSPPGDHLAYVVHWPDDHESLFVDGEDETREFCGPGPQFNLSRPLWSPDGSVIAIASDASLINVGGAYVNFGSQRLGPYRSHPATVLHEPCWSPDGSQLVFKAQDLDGRTYVFAGPTKLGPFDAVDMNILWSPDSQSVAFRAGISTLVVGGTSFQVDESYPVVTGWSTDSRVVAYRTTSGPKVLVDGVGYPGALRGNSVALAKDGAVSILHRP